MRHFPIEGLVMAAVVSGAALAQAQEQSPAAASGPPTTAAAAPAQSTAAGAPASAPAGSDKGGVVEDGARFRFGVSGGAGFFKVSSEVGPGEASCTYYGVDLRLGAQVNDLIGVYAQPALGYYSVDGSGNLAAGGLLGMAVVADVTLIDRLFVGGGLGYTIYNNPSGVSPMLRIGGYPLMARSDEKARRKGLMVGLDLRLTGLEGLKTIVMPTFNVGYDAF